VRLTARGRKPPSRAIKRPARPYNSAIRNWFAVANAKGARPSRAKAWTAEAVDVVRRVLGRPGPDELVRGVVAAEEADLHHDAAVGGGLDEAAQAREVRRVELGHLPAPRTAGFCCEAPTQKCHREGSLWRARRARERPGRARTVELPAALGAPGLGRPLPRRDEAPVPRGERIPRGVVVFGVAVRVRLDVGPREGLGPRQSTMRLQFRHRSPVKDRLFPVKLPISGADISKRIARGGHSTTLSLILCSESPMQAARALEGAATRTGPAAADLRQREVLGGERVDCPGREPPKRAVKRSAHPYKSAIKKIFAMGTAKGA
jgi:hypothetical protein